MACLLQAAVDKAQECERRAADAERRCKDAKVHSLAIMHMLRRWCQPEHDIPSPVKGCMHCCCLPSAELWCLQHCSWCGKQIEAVCNAAFANQQGNLQGFSHRLFAEQQFQAVLLTG